MIKFILNREFVETSDHVGVTLLDFVRERSALKGTKIGCREGDCGACTVLVGSLTSKSVSYHSITSCISPLGNAHGKHIVTIEGVNLPETLNTVQQAMADNHATQCGFCTPGFVVSMTGCSLRLSNFDLDNSNKCIDSISGNICRCTGYKSIEKAAASVLEKLRESDRSHHLDWLIQENFIPSYFKGIHEKLKKIRSIGSNLTGRIVANGTDIYVHDADSLSEKPVQLIGEDRALKGIVFRKDHISFGANTTVTEMLEDSQLNRLFPKLKSNLKLVSSEQIRNMGTLGGNFVNASPIGDMSIFFLALNSTLQLQHKNGSIRSISFKDFHQQYKQVDLKKEELVFAISMPLPLENTFFNFEKVSKRTYLDIASVNSALSISLVNNLISDVHIALGGVAAIPKYLIKTQDFLLGKPIEIATIVKAAAILQSEITPISDVRGSTGYKRLLAKQLFFAHFVELFPEKRIFQNLITL